eukprot:scaffold269606_cov27-Tisochrysis_lutea.AAC.1
MRRKRCGSVGFRPRGSQLRSPAKRTGELALKTRHVRGMNAAPTWVVIGLQAHEIAVRFIRIRPALLDAKRFRATDAQCHAEHDNWRQLGDLLDGGPSNAGEQRMKPVTMQATSLRSSRQSCWAGNECSSAPLLYQEATCGEHGHTTVREFSLPPPEDLRL